MVSRRQGGGDRPTARNVRTRWSAFIRPEAATNIILAAGHASKTGRDLNRFVTINFDQGELLGRAQGALGAYLKLGADWLRLRGVEATHVWVLENGPGKGLHVHILQHVPRELSPHYSALQKGWLRNAGLTPNKANVIRSKGIKSPRALRGVLKYLLKGGHPEFLQQFCGQIRGDGGSVIYGKRCGTSQNIGAKARASGVSSGRQRFSGGAALPIEEKRRSTTAGDHRG